MKTRLLILALGCLLLAPASAEAFTWHLSLFKAKAATKQSEKEICERDSKCIAYGATCERITESRIDCIGGTIDETAYGELECQSVYHWGVNRDGYAKVRIARPHCYYLE